MLLRALSKPFLNTDRLRALTTSLGTLGQGFPPFLLRNDSECHYNILLNGFNCRWHFPVGHWRYFVMLIFRVAGAWGRMCESWRHIWKVFFIEQPTKSVQVPFLLHAYSGEVCPAPLAKEGSKKQQQHLGNKKVFFGGKWDQWKSMDLISCPSYLAGNSALFLPFRFTPGRENSWQLKHRRWVCQCEYRIPAGWWGNPRHVDAGKLHVSVPFVSGELQPFFP